MALSASPTRTTLWDQFGYTGRPEEFSWILPIQGGPDVRVELADVRFLAALDDATGAQVEPVRTPERQCPVCYTPPPAVQYVCGRQSPAAYDSAGRGAFADAAASADASVTVLREEAVGPYQVTTLRGSDAGALREWLNTNHYVVPAALEPVLDHYVGLHMDFVALRLRDGAGAGKMQPVRVTMPGYQPLLPLRMVAAGVADHVEMVLFTLADSRLEATNFNATELRDADLAWEFGRDTTPIGAFRRAEAAVGAAAGGRAWLTESAVTSSRAQLDALAANALRRYVAESDAGTPTEDMNVALETLGASPVLARLHADLTVDRKSVV
jgi:hypothetical protein